jgi:hypothetical protein
MTPTNIRTNPNQKVGMEYNTKVTPEALTSNLDPLLQAANMPIRMPAMIEITEAADSSIAVLIRLGIIRLITGALVWNESPRFPLAVFLK